MLRSQTPLALLALTACSQGHVATLTPHGLLVLDQAALDLGSSPLDSRTETSLQVANSGGLALEVTLTLADPESPFSLSHTAVSLAPGEAIPVTIWFEPPATVEAQADTLTLTPAEGEPVTLPLTAVADADGDDDGHEHLDLGGDDCDDTRADVSPSASETWYDDLDQDCDGGSDHDADGDDWEQEPLGQDCDDGDPDVRPDAEEIWYDDVDQDCDQGSDHDADQDGADRSPEGDDCDDTDALVHPNANEIWYDGVDQDCDSASDFDADQDGHESELWSGDDCDDSDADAAPGLAEEDDLQDDDCDGLVDEDYLAAGDVLVSEVLIDPGATYDHYGQFVELTNASARTVDLTGWALGAGGGVLVLDSGLRLSPGDQALLCVDDDTVVNGSLACDATWDGAFTLASPDALELSAGALVLDEVAWTPLWPLAEGASLSLDPDAIDAVANDDRSAWCAATSVMASGDLGTPGLPNDACP